MNDVSEHIDLPEGEISGEEALQVPDLAKDFRNAIDIDQKEEVIAFLLEFMRNNKHVFTDRNLKILSRRITLNDKGRPTPLRTLGKEFNLTGAGIRVALKSMQFKMTGACKKEFGFKFEFPKIKGLEFEP